MYRRDEAVKVDELCFLAVYPSGSESDVDWDGVVCAQVSGVEGLVRRGSERAIAGCIPAVYVECREFL